jgi:fused signal recognition particle receptor
MISQKEAIEDLNVCMRYFGGNGKTKEEIIENLKNINKQLDLSGNKNTPNVLIISGANGSGKTTTIGKISYLLNLKNFVLILILN